MKFLDLIDIMIEEIETSRTFKDCMGFIEVSVTLLNSKVSFHIQPKGFWDHTLEAHFEDGKLPVIKWSTGGKNDNYLAAKSFHKALGLLLDIDHNDIRFDKINEVVGIAMNNAIEEARESRRALKEDKEKFLGSLSEQGYTQTNPKEFLKLLKEKTEKSERDLVYFNIFFPQLSNENKWYLYEVRCRMVKTYGNRFLMYYWGEVYSQKSFLRDLSENYWIEKSTLD